MKLAQDPAADNLPCTFVIFGATGNLASNKLLPALYHLEAAGRLAESLSIIAFSRRDWTTENWREHMRKMLDGKIKVAPFVEKHPLRDINRVFEATHSGALKRRAVLVPNA